MAKQNTKSKTSESLALPVPTPVVTQVSTPVPVQVPVVVAAGEVKQKKPKAAKQSVVETPVPVLTQTQTQAPVQVPVKVEAVKTEDVAVVAPELDNTLLERSAEFVTKLQQIGTLINSLKSEYKSLERQWGRDIKLASKSGSKKKKRTGSRAPSGFVKPTLISDELAGFLEKPSGSEMARTEVTRDINKYIRTNGLQDKTNGRKINPDQKLCALLKIKSGEELTYFNLQRYMSCHFSKNAVKTASESVSATVSA